LFWRWRSEFEKPRNDTADLELGQFDARFDKREFNIVVEVGVDDKAHDREHEKNTADVAVVKCSVLVGLNLLRDHKRIFVINIEQDLFVTVCYVGWFNFDHGWFSSELCYR